MAGLYKKCMYCMHATSVSTNSCQILSRHSNDCSYIISAVTVRYQCSSYSVKEGDGICLPIEASGNLSRDFEVTVNLGKQIAAGWLCCTVYASRIIAPIITKVI